MATLAEFIKENYPSPTDGTTFNWGGSIYTWDATPGVWTATTPQPEDIQNVATEATAPSNPAEGDLWYDGEKLNVRSGEAWVDASPQPTAEDLDIVSTISVSKNGASLNDINNINLIQADPSGSGNVAIVQGAEGQANVTITFPEIPAAPPSTPTPSTENAGTYVASVPSSGETSWTELPDALADASIENVGNVSSATPTNGQVLAWDSANEEWAPTAATEASPVTVSADGKTITISGTDHEIPVVETATLSGSNLVLTRNDDTDLMVDLSGLGGDSALPENKIFIDGTTNSVSRIDFEGQATATVSGSIATVEVPEYILKAERNGTEVASGITTLNFKSSNFSLTDAGDGKVDITVSGGGDTETTGVTNINQQGNLLQSTDSTNKKQFVLTGGSGGTRHKVLLKNASTSTTQIKWTASKTDVSTLHMTGSHSWGIWDPQVPQIYVAPESPTTSTQVWPNNTNRTMAAGEIMLFEIDMPNNATFTFDFSTNNVAWNHTPVTQNTGEIQVVDVPEDAPVAESDDIETVGEVNDDWHGLYYIPFSDETQEGSDIIPWDIQTNDNFNRSLEKALFATQVGGNGDDLPRSTSGNAYWGTDASGPRAGLWMESWGTTITSGSTDALNHGITIVLPRADGEDPVLEYLEEYANASSVWHSAPVTLMRDDSYVKRLGSGNDGRIISSSVWLPTDGNNSGSLAGIRSLSGPGNGPFSNQFTFSASSANYFAGWDTALTTPGFLGKVSAQYRHNYNWLALNVPNDPEFAILEVRRRGRPRVNDPLLGSVGVDNNGIINVYIEEDSNLGGTHNFAAQYQDEPEVGARTERGIIVTAKSSDFSVVKPNGYTGSDAHARRDNSIYFMRGIPGTTPDYGTGVTHTNASINRLATSLGSLGSGPVQPKFALRMDADASITGLPELSDAEREAAGLTALSSGKSYYGPIKLQREAPMCVITDTDSPAPATWFGEHVGRAVLWQLEYRLRTG